MRFVALVLLVGLAAPAQAETHYVTIVNATGSVMDSIRFSPAGAAGQADNRLRAKLPPNSEARISISTGCTIDVRVGFTDLNADERLNVDACGDPRVTFVAVGSSPDAAPPGEAPQVSASATSAREPPPMAPAPEPVTIPPSKRYDGHSLTKRLGLDGWVDP